MSQKIVTQSTNTPQDRLRAAFRRLHRHSVFTYKVPPARPMTFTEQFKAAFLRGLRVRR